jgi:hypothetical protein
MFPRFFEAQVAQRLAVWGAMLGFLVSLYAAVELIHTSRMGEVSREIGRAAAYMKAHAGADAAFSRIAVQVLRGDQAELTAENEKLRELAVRERELSGDADARKIADERALLLDRIGDFRLSADIRIAALGALGEMRTMQGDAIAGSLERLYAHQQSLLASDRKNKLLIAFLAIFVVGQILFLEYRWLVKPIVRMAAVLRKGGADVPRAPCRRIPPRRDRRSGARAFAAFRHGVEGQKGRERRARGAFHPFGPAGRSQA